jgi:hypothetical protein
MLTGPLNSHTGNLVYHTLSPSFAEVGLTSPSPNPCQSMMPILGAPQQPALRYTMAVHPHAGLSEQADKGKPTSIRLVQSFHKFPLLTPVALTRQEQAARSNDRMAPRRYSLGNIRFLSTRCHSPFAWTSVEMAPSCACLPKMATCPANVAATSEPANLLQIRRLHRTYPTCLANLASRWYDSAEDRSPGPYPKTSSWHSVIRIAFAKSTSLLQTQ